jgi:hypothetical protein
MNIGKMSGLSPKAKPTAEAIARTCERYGIGCQFGQTGKHPYAQITVNRQTRKVYFSSTPSDYRGWQNVISDVKKTARSLGWEPTANHEEDTEMQTVKTLADLPRLAEPGCPPLPENWIGKPVRGRITHPDLLAAYARRNEWIMQQVAAGVKRTDILAEMRRAGWDITSAGAVDMVVFKAKGGKYPSEIKRYERLVTEAPTQIQVTVAPAPAVQPAPASEGLDPLVLAIASVIAPLIREQLAQQAKQMETYKAKADKWDAIAGLVRDDA